MDPKRPGVTFVVHYLDDFLTIGPPKSARVPGGSGDNQGSMPQAWNPTGFGKSGRAMYRTDLSWNNTGHGNEKLGRVKAAVHEWLLKKSATKREILSLVGLLQHATGQGGHSLAACTAQQHESPNFTTK